MKRNWSNEACDADTVVWNMKGLVSYKIGIGLVQYLVILVSVKSGIMEVCHQIILVLDKFNISIVVDIAEWRLSSFFDTASRHRGVLLTLLSQWIYKSILT